MVLIYIRKLLIGVFNVLFKLQAQKKNVAFILVVIRTALCKSD